ncbi:MAG: NADH dehydrogenase [Thermodesulfobacteriota bacterium]|nr:MAG: NADH dehydrogenase [Thermodesulfobacteriota bacterium]
MSKQETKKEELHHVVVLGGGFGGLYASKTLSKGKVKVTVIDKRNFHLFQPLLYQVAAGWLSPGDIASPLRVVLNDYQDTYVLKAEVTDIVPKEKKVVFRDGEITYDTLIVATGSYHHYFGHDNWAQTAPGLKTVEDALEMRRKILLSFEAAERETDPKKQKEWMTFLIIGAGPTGVELAGTIGELTRTTLKDDFRNINTEDAKIILVEGLGQVLPTYPLDLSAKAEKFLKKLGVTIKTNAMVTDIKDSKATISRNGDSETIQSRTILWTAGVKASSLGKALAKNTGAQLDKSGRILVNPDLSVPGQPDVFVIGDLANLSHEGKEPLPGVAPVAMQEGKYVAKLILNRLKGKETKPFEYKEKGNLAVIGTNSAVADLGKFKFAGFFAWLVWVFVHIRYLIEFDSKVIILFRWSWNYFTRKRGVRLITGEDPFPLVDSKKK